jgi:hypothetical protein
VAADRAVGYRTTRKNTSHVKIGRTMPERLRRNLRRVAASRGGPTRRLTTSPRPRRSGSRRTVLDGARRLPPYRSRRVSVAGALPRGAAKPSTPRRPKFATDAARRPPPTPSVTIRRDLSPLRDYSRDFATPPDRLRRLRLFRDASGEFATSRGRLRRLYAFCDASRDIATALGRSRRLRLFRDDRREDRNRSRQIATPPDTSRHLAMFCDASRDFATPLLVLRRLRMLCDGSRGFATSRPTSRRLQLHRDGPSLFRDFSRDIATPLLVSRRLGRLCDGEGPAAPG